MDKHSPIPLITWQEPIITYWIRKKIINDKISFIERIKRNIPYMFGIAILLLLEFILVIIKGIKTNELESTFIPLSIITITIIIIINSLTIIFRRSISFYEKTIHIMPGALEHINYEDIKEYIIQQIRGKEMAYDAIILYDNKNKIIDVFLVTYKIDLNKLKDILKEKDINEKMQKIII